MKKYVSEYTDFLKIEKRQSQNTVESYRRDVSRFEKYLSNNQLGGAKTSDVRSFLVFLRNEEGLAPSSVARCLSSLKSFYNFLYIEPKFKIKMTLRGSVNSAFIFRERRFFLLLLFSGLEMNKKISMSIG